MPSRATSSQMLEKNKGIHLEFHSVDPAVLAREVEQFFLGQRYRVEGGDQWKTIYGRGSNVLRLLFGAFVKRFRFESHVYQDGPLVTLEVTKGMSGAAGGALGHRSMTKETQRICEALAATFA